MPTKQARGQCSLLVPGMSFEGTQNVGVSEETGDPEEWKVRVTIQDVRVEDRYVCGLMEAYGVPSMESPVITYFEGDIITNVHEFFTQQWNASKKTDMQHWTRFDAFNSLKQRVLSDGDEAIDLLEQPCLFMRWKEKCFVNYKEECGLTIQGFYYVVVNRADGSVKGLYYDPNSAPYQKLDLQPTCGGRGLNFASFSFA
eukprot:Colp12_sorted_trinity150504_noHs@29836